MGETSVPSNSPQLWDVIIIGSGPAGLTAAIYTTRAALSTLVLAGSRWGGQLMLTTEVENYPGFPDGILGPELILSMRRQAERLKANFIDSDVTAVDFHSSPFTLKTDTNTYSSLDENKVLLKAGSYQAKSVIIATGAASIWLGVPGEQQFIGRGVSSCAPCDAAFFKDLQVVVVGGGDSAMEEALVLTKFASQVTIIHRRNTFRASKILQDRVLHHPQVKIIYDSQVAAVLGDQKVTGIKLNTTAGTAQAQKLKAGQIKDWSGEILEEKADVFSWQMPTNGVFVAVGHTPNTAIFKGQIDLDEKGYIKVTDHTKTNIEGVFVAGDVHDFHYRQAITAAGFGCMAAIDAQKWIEQQH